MLIFKLLIFTGTFSPQVLIHHLTAEMEDGMEKQNC